MSAPDGPTRLDDLFEVADEHRGEYRALMLLGIGGLALAVILAAFFVGRGLAGRPASEPAAAPPQGSGPGTAGVGASESPGASRSARPAVAPNGRLVGDPYRGRLGHAPVRSAAATCVAEPSVDSGGNRVSYRPGNMLDRSASTAWRCAGDGRGVTLTFRLPERRRIAAVGLVPGYAKTDPFSHADRYAENRRVSRVRWAFDGGRWVEQTLRTGPHTRRLQTVRIPPVRTETVRVTIEGSVPAPRNTVAVSTVRLAAPRR